MPQIVFIQPDGSRREVEAVSGESVMRTALLNDVQGIVAECGGNAVCATCHVYIEEAMLERLTPVLPIENELLDATIAPRLPTSRLSCQIVIQPELSGLIVHIPDEQL